MCQNFCGGGTVVCPVLRNPLHNVVTNDSILLLLLSARHNGPHQIVLSFI